jgi:hypothetical protein
MSGFSNTIFKQVENVFREITCQAKWSFLLEDLSRIHLNKFNSNQIVLTISKHRFRVL